MFLNGDLMAEEFPLHIKSNVIEAKVAHSSHRPSHHGSAGTNGTAARRRGRLGGDGGGLCKWMARFLGSLLRVNKHNYTH